VGTPGTVMDLVRRRQFDVSQLKALVIDEADNMLDQQGMGDQCIRVKGMLPKNKLGRAMFKKLKVYSGPTHPHQAQQPHPLEVKQPL